MGFSGNNTVELQAYDEEGQVKGRYYFFDEFWAKVCVKDASKTGWYDADGVDQNPPVYTCCNETALEFGQGVMLMSGEDDTTLTYAGQVVDEDQEFDLWGNDLFTYCGNCSAKPINLGDVAIPTDLGFSGNNTIELQTYDEEGQVKGRYYFFDEFWAKVCVKDSSKTGWYDANGVDQNPPVYTCCNETAQLAIGEMFMVMSGEDDMTITIPAAIKKGE